MLDNFKDVAETLRNRFAESPLGKQLEGMDFDNIDNGFLAVVGGSNAAHVLLPWMLLVKSAIRFFGAYLLARHYQQQ